MERLSNPGNALGHILAATGLLLPLLGLFSPNMVAVLAVALLFGVLAADRLRGGPWPRPDRSLALLFGAGLGWAAISLAWTPLQADAAGKWTLVAASTALAAWLLPAAVRLSPGARRRVGWCIVAGTSAAVALLLFEIASGGILARLFMATPPLNPGITDLYLRAAAVLAVTTWTAVAVLWPNRRPAAVALVLAGLLATGLHQNASAVLAFGSGCVVLVATIAAPRAMRWLLPVLLAGGILAAPLLSQTLLDPQRVVQQVAGLSSSVVHRLEIWRYCSEMIEERPIVGWGFHSSRALPGAADPLEVRNEKGEVIGAGARLPLHPHNGAIQLRLELGLPGAILGAALAALLAWRALGLGLLAPVGAALVTTGTLIWLLSFGVWQGWWQSLLWLAGLLLAAVAGGSRARPVARSEPD